MYVIDVTIMIDVWKHRYTVYRNETKQNDMTIK